MTSLSLSVCNCSLAFSAVINGIYVTADCLLVMYGVWLWPGNICKCCTRCDYTNYTHVWPLIQACFLCSVTDNAPSHGSPPGHPQPVPARDHQVPAGSLQVQWQLPQQGNSSAGEKLLSDLCRQVTTYSLIGCCIFHPLLLLVNMTHLGW